MSPWLLSLNLLATLLSAVSAGQSWLYRVALGLSLVGLCLSCLPLVQFPAVQRQAEATLQRALGRDYLEKIASPQRVSLAAQPLNLARVFTGISLPPIRPTGIQFAHPEGVPLRLEIYRPPTAGLHPTIVNIYGGAWKWGNPTQDDKFNRYMAGKGYTVIAIDYRHAPRYRFPAQLQDVQTALAFIWERVTEYGIDRDRVALLGRSAGAHLAMLTAFQPDALPVRAVVSYYGPINLTVGYREPPNPDPIDSRAVLQAFLGGSPDDFPELYRKASPISWVRPDLPPTLLIYGGRDHIVQARYGREMANLLQAQGNSAPFMEIPWAEHAFDAVFSGISNQLALYYTERFLGWALRPLEPSSD